MILLDALYINNSGGRVLLNYLVSELHRSRMEVFFLLDARVEGSFGYLPPDRVTYLKASLWKRHRFYQRHRSSFSGVLCFGNIPPSVRLQVPVFTYFQNTVYFYTTKSFSLVHRMVLLAKATIIRLLGSNTTEWWVQTEAVRSMFRRFWGVEPEKVRCYPFFDDQTPGLDPMQKPVPRSFLYVSDGHPNKLHRHLLSAMRIIARSEPDATLSLTISQQYPDLLREIESMQQAGIRVYNLGWCSREDLARRYQQSAFLVYPSNMESFGLGLIEAAQYGMRILAADLPYVKAVIEPSLLFNQEDPEAIAAAMLKAMQQELPAARVVVDNCISAILQRLQETC